MKSQRVRDFKDYCHESWIKLNNKMSNMKIKRFDQCFLRNKSLMFTIIVVFIIFDFLLFSRSHKIDYHPDSSYTLVSTTHETNEDQLLFVRFEGDYAVFHYTGVFSVVYGFFSYEKPTKTLTLSKGNSLGSFQNNSYIYSYHSKETLAKKYLYYSLATVPHIQGSSSTFMYIELDYHREECSNYHFKVKQAEDLNNGCLEMTYFYKGKGEVYGYYFVNTDEHIPDSINIRNEGLYWGYQDNTSFSVIYCSLHQHTDYVFGMVGIDKNCISNVHYTKPFQIEFDSKFFWAHPTLFSYHELGNYKFGVQYRRFGGVDVIDAKTIDESTLGVQVASKDSDLVTIPTHNYYNSTFSKEHICDDDKSRSIKIREIERKGKNINSKLLIVSNGDLFVYYTQSKKEKVDANIIIKEGEYLGYFKDEFVYVQLKKLPKENLHVYFVMSCKLEITEVVSASI